jgi:hypothetical protein
MLGEGDSRVVEYTESCASRVQEASAISSSSVDVGSWGACLAMS